MCLTLNKENKSLVLTTCETKKYRIRKAGQKVKFIEEGWLTVGGKCIHVQDKNDWYRIKMYRCSYTLFGAEN